MHLYNYCTKYCYEAVELTGSPDLNEILTSLPTAEDAPFNAYLRQHDLICLPDTRVDLLQHISYWADGQDERCIFWLNGLAGTGKSTIARTVARRCLEQNRLGASFLFSRGGGDVGHAGKFVTSIAWQLANSVPSLDQHICDAVKKQRDIASKSLYDQWQQLVMRPLSNLSESGSQSSYVLVVDALDECDDDNNIRTIIRLLAEARSLKTVRLRIFLTSRPETPIRLGFRAMPQIVHHDLELHGIPRAVVNHDLAVFLIHEFNTIRNDFEDLPCDWPGNDKIEDLVRRSDGLFIYAATACRFIKGDGYWLPQVLLDLVLQGNRSSHQMEIEHDIPSRSPTWELDEMYTQILQRSLINVRSEDRERVSQTLKEVIGTLVILAEPLSGSTLANLLRMRLEMVNLRLGHLRSVLNIPVDQNYPIQLLHPTFRDFLLDDQRCLNQLFWIDEKQAHRVLADRCMQLMSTLLKQDICGVDAPGTLVANVKSQIEQVLPPEIQYACRYWIDHVQKSDSQLYDNGQLHQFLQEHLLHWLEALGWIGKVPEGVHAIASLESVISVSIPPARKRMFH